MIQPLSAQTESSSTRSTSYKLVGPASRFAPAVDVDGNTSWGTGYAPGSLATLSNSQIALDVKNTVVVRSGKNLVVKWRVKPIGKFPATTLYGYQLVQDTGFLSTPWTLLGTY